MPGWLPASRFLSVGFRDDLRHAGITVGSASWERYTSGRVATYATNLGVDRPTGMKRLPKQKRHRLIAARQAAGFTQFSLAKKTKLTIQTVFSCENGYHDPKHNTMRVILKALEIPYEDRHHYFDLEGRSNE